MADAAASDARRRPAPAQDTQPADSSFDAGALQLALAAPASLAVRWRPWLLLAAALTSALLCLAVMRLVAGLPAVPGVWVTGAQGTLVLAASPLDELQPHIGRGLVALRLPDGSELRADSGLQRRLSRWIVDDVERSNYVARADQLAMALAQPNLTLRMDDGSLVRVAPKPHGVGGLGPLFWVFMALAAALQWTAAAVLVARPQLRNALYALMALAQSGNLMLIAEQSVPGLGAPLAPNSSALWHMALDFVTAAAAVHAFALHPRRLAEARKVALLAWGLPIFLLALALGGQLPGLWWWTQGVTLGMGVLAVAVLTRSYRAEPHPFALVLRRFSLLAVASLALSTLVMADAAARAPGARDLAAVGALAWTLLFAALLLLVPFVARGRALTRELLLLATVGLVATTLTLLFVAVGVGEPSALVLSLVLTLALHAAARPWLLSGLVGGAPTGSERSFEQLYRAASEVRRQPSRLAEPLGRLLTELFDPRDLQQLTRPSSRARVLGDGAALLVPVQADGAPPTTLLLRYARQGRRLFTVDDARLAERIADQLRRAVAYDLAVERGRKEERQRIAQDLHDDIGARLLTLMYQAQTPEMEDYLRHTLLDLKTLTRGLAATEHRLSHAAVEWKRDVGQRLEAARVRLEWRFEFDQDLTLSVVQWSALTRVLRELVSNTIMHAKASRVEIVCNIERGALSLRVMDDGVGRAPQDWSHGLGLGGVRKRIKQLGGEVRWRENGAQGIICEAEVPDLMPRR